MLRFIGLDIGTSSISGIVIDGENGDVLKTISVENNTKGNALNPVHIVQSPSDIIEKALKIKNTLIENYAPIDAIGVTGQMHGILYLDKDGNPVSPLYTWQDQSGNTIYKDDKTYCQYLSELTGFNLSSGYGLVTDFVNRQTNNVLSSAAKICTIHDYLVMSLTDKKEPVTHTSDAASLGCFDFKTNDFDLNALKKINLKRELLPKVLNDCEIVGNDEHGIPVAVAIGDNQSSVIGSVKGKNSALVNIGTGSQISVISDSLFDFKEGETRPLYKDKYLLVGAPLCGGRAYAILHDFFCQCANLFGGDEEYVYLIMGEIAQEEKDRHTLNVSTKFSGTRKDPTIKGCISNITTENFNPAELIRGFLWGISEDLFEFFKEIESIKPEKVTSLVGSGNAIRRNPLLKYYIEEIFSLPLNIPKHKEEAAFGAAIFASVASKKYETIEKAQNQLIKYI